MTASDSGLARQRVLGGLGRLPNEGKMMTDEQLVDSLAQEYEIARTTIHILGQIHDRVAGLYMHLIDEWRATHPTDAERIGLQESRETRPPNYSETMTRLRNTSWRGYEPNFGGFCIREPVVRILQLAKYPIGQFITLTISEPPLAVPPRPEVPASTASPVNIARVEAVAPLVKAREQWLTDLCRVLDSFTDRISQARGDIRLD